MSKRKPYHHNNWKQYKDSPDKFFIPLAFDEFMDWKIAGWEIPSSVSCIIREHNRVTGKIKEHVYKREGDARNKARAIMEAGESDFTVCTRDAIKQVYQQPYEDYDYDEY
tara:strand:+ start:108 stop:437 length:330 start_codon:yes stop_codon:yes gene_type:complete